MGSSSKRAPVPPPLSFDSASAAASGTPTAVQNRTQEQQEPQPQTRAEQYEPYQDYQAYQAYQQYQTYRDYQEQQPQYQDACYSPDYSQYSTDPPSYTSQEAPRTASGEYFPPQASSRRKSSHSSTRKCSSPTVNGYTYCGRHSNEWLFNGHGFSDIKKIFKKDERK